MEKGAKGFARPLVVLLSLTLSLFLLASLFPPSTAAAQTCKFKHTVKPGETLSYIATLYGVSIDDIAKANSLTPPYVIIAGQVLCIPGGTQPAVTGTPKKKPPVLIVSPSIGHVFVSVENFRPKTTYYVRVYPFEKSALSYRIGYFTTNKEGDFSDWFKLPAYVPRTTTMKVCVKNVWTDAVSCAMYQDPTPSMLYSALISIPRCQKEGR